MMDHLPEEVSPPPRTAHAGVPSSAKQRPSSVPAWVRWSLCLPYRTRKRMRGKLPGQFLLGVLLLLLAIPGRGFRPSWDGPTAGVSSMTTRTTRPSEFTILSSMAQQQQQQRVYLQRPLPLGLVDRTGWQRPSTILSFSSSTSDATPQDNKPVQSSSALSATDAKTDTNPTSTASNRLDRVLSRLTLGFPLYVVLAAVVGLYHPSSLDWVNRGSLISLLLAGVMCGTGLTLTSDDFKALPPRTVALGVACQFGVMPAAAWGIGKVCLQQSFPELFLGLCLVGCSPGGTASNLVSLIANADVALSVVLTACSTLLAVAITPALVKLLVAASDIDISGFTLVMATAKVVLGPVILGMLLKAKAPALADSLSRYTPFASTLLVALICGGVVAQNASIVLAAQAAWLPRVLLSVLALHSIGFAAGYFIPNWILSRTGPPSGSPSTTSSVVTSRTISIEVGMQNSALAVVLARSLGGPATLAALPGALSATVHSCLGSALAALWRRRDERSSSPPPPRHVDPEIHPTYGPLDPEFSI